MKYTQEQLTEIFMDAVELFNETMDEDYEVCKDGIMIRFFTPKNGMEVYEEFCSTYFPHHLKENYKNREKYENMAAEAFVSELYSGVMIRADLAFPEADLLQIFAHEIAHIYCTRNEIDGGDFYGRFCDDPYHPVYGENIDKRMNGYINAGYAVWREAIADIISIEAVLDICQLNITDDMIKRLYSQMKYGNPDAKRAASMLITYVMLRNEEDIAKRYTYFNKSTIRMLELVADKLSVQPFFEITPDFIAKLGSAYLMALTEKYMNK